MKAFVKMENIYLNQYYSDDSCCRIEFACSIEDLQTLVSDLQTMLFFDSVHQEKINQFIKLFEYVIEKKVDKKS